MPKIAELRAQGVFTGEVAERLAALLRTAPDGKPRPSILSPRVTTVSGKLAIIRSIRRLGAAASQNVTGDEGGGYAVRVIPEVRGKVVHADIVGIEGPKEGITHTGRLFYEIVDVPLDRPVVFWLAPTKDDPNDLAFVMRFITVDW